MSKSLNNLYTIKDLEEKGFKPEVYRMFNFSSHYKKPINFTFEAYGLSRDQFNTYVEECKKRGYSIDLSYVDGFYSANNTEGYNIKAMYDEENHQITAAISSPKANYE